METLNDWLEETAMILNARTEEQARAIAGMLAYNDHARHLAAHVAAGLPGVVYRDPVIYASTSAAGLPGVVYRDPVIYASTSAAGAPTPAAPSTGFTYQPSSPPIGGAQAQAGVTPPAPMLAVNGHEYEAPTPGTNAMLCRRCRSSSISYGFFMSVGNHPSNAHLYTVCSNPAPTVAAPMQGLLAQVTAAPTPSTGHGYHPARRGLVWTGTRHLEICTDCMKWAETVCKHPMVGKHQRIPNTRTWMCTTDVLFTDGDLEELFKFIDSENAAGRPTAEYKAPVCECGAAKTGAKAGSPAHSRWCPVGEKGTPTR